MIQRVQSLYLGAATVMFLVVAAGVKRSDAVTTLAGTASVTLALVLAVASLAAVFLFSKRSLQRYVVAGVRWVALGLLLALGVAIYLGDTLVQLIALKPDGLVVALVATLVGHWMLSLASRAIRKDIVLIKSMDRIR